MSRFVLCLALVAVAAIDASATDLSRIDRTIKKEPAYKSSPKYCFLVFGPEAATRVWLVFDGDVLYVDRNGNGDLTDPGERLAPINTLKRVHEWWEFRTGKLGTCSDLLIRVGRSGAFICAEGRFLQVAFKGLEFALHATRAPIIHFDGPLTLAPDAFSWDNRVSLTRGEEAEFHVKIGTPGRGVGTFASIPFIERGIADRVSPDGPKAKPVLQTPKGIHPVMEVEFPGSPSRTVRYALSKRC